MNNASKTTRGAAWRWLARLVRWIYFRVCWREVLETSSYLCAKSGECAKSAAQFDSTKSYMAGYLDGKATVYLEWSTALRKNLDSANTLITQTQHKQNESK